MLYFLVFLIIGIGGLVAWWVFDILGIGHRVTRKKKYDKKRESGRQAIPQVLVELRRNIDSATPDWINLASNISLRGMLVHLPPEVRMGDLLYVGFTLGDPRTSFIGLEAIVIRRGSGGLGVLGFPAWPLEKQNELAAWLQERAA